MVIKKSTVPIMRVVFKHTSAKYVMSALDCKALKGVCDTLCEELVKNM